MAEHLLMLCLFFALPFATTLANTDPSDVRALQDIYRVLDFPPQLTGWKPIGGDPCGEGWKGISCSGTSVQSININGSGLNGMLQIQPGSLLMLKDLDASSNNIHGEIPSYLPPSVTHINLAFNQFTHNIPALDTMNRLCYLNLSHNSLSGPIGDVFVGLVNLKQMDLSDNDFTGDLPSSFSTLTNLTELFLQNNKFTGAISFLAHLPLSVLDIQNNNFSGILPVQFDVIRNLHIEGNMFMIGAGHSAEAMPPKNLSTEQNSSSFKPLGMRSSSTNYHSQKADIHSQRRLVPAATASIAGAVVLVTFCVATLITIYICISNKPQLKKMERICSTLRCLTTSKSVKTPRESREQSPEDSFHIHQRSIHFICHGRAESISRRILPERDKTLTNLTSYSIADLEVATRNFSEKSLIKHGSLGSVYEGVFPNNQILAVKKINMMPLDVHEEEQFLEIIQKMSHLRHPNVESLLGYCMDQWHYILVYEYAGNLSLEDALHSPQAAILPLSWNARVRIAFGVASSLSYLHSTCSPPVAHGSITASNVLLDKELMPLVSDWGLDALRFLTCYKNVELSLDCKGYTAPEFGKPDFDKTKCDIYAFGVLLLELLTGRKPCNSSLVREQKSLVKWASTYLQDYQCLEEMVDPTIKGSCCSIALPQFANVIALCIRTDPELRPPISQITKSLAALIPKPSVINHSGCI